ncbi:MAG: hypothetical protein ACPGC4_01085 [Litorivicinaceae bacterium]
MNSNELPILTDIECSVEYLRENHEMVSFEDVRRLKFIKGLIQAVSDRAEQAVDYNHILAEFEREENRRLDADAMQSIRRAQR